VDGLGLYEFVGENPGNALDPMGLDGEFFQVWHKVKDPKTGQVFVVSTDIKMEKITLGKQFTLGQLKEALNKNKDNPKLSPNEQRAIKTMIVLINQVAIRATWGVEIKFGFSFEDPKTAAITEPTRDINNKIIGAEIQIHGNVLRSDLFFHELGGHALPFQMGYYPFLLFTEDQVEGQYYLSIAILEELLQYQNWLQAYQQMDRQCLTKETLAEIIRLNYLINGLGMSKEEFFANVNIGLNPKEFNDNKSWERLKDLLKNLSKRVLDIDRY
jgi:hypothetical protein